MTREVRRPGIGTMASATNLPREGMMATVRNRRALIARVKPFDTKEGRLHLVELEYTDSEGSPTESVIWEREVAPRAHAASRTPPRAAASGPSGRRRTWNSRRFPPSPWPGRRRPRASPATTSPPQSPPRCPRRRPPGRASSDRWRPQSAPRRCCWPLGQLPSSLSISDSRNHRTRFSSVRVANSPP